MTKSDITILNRFYSYQKERFPLAVLAISLLPAILSSGAVVAGKPTIVHVLIALIASLVYLFHIRVIDERRDFSHDSQHHAKRPIQIGLISRKELENIDMSSIIVLLVLAALAGMYSLALAGIMLFYSYLAGKEFFLGERIRQHFFTYNTVNLMQMLLMQVFVYSVFVGLFSFNNIVLAHFLFTSTGTIIFEFLRKLKIPGEDGTGRDTYTWHLGFSNSLAAYSLLALANIFLFFRITTMISLQTFNWLILSIFSGTIITISIVSHWKKRSHLTDQILQGCFLLAYAVFNIIIYFIKIH